jgi:hypothetical protein
MCKPWARYGRGLLVNRWYQRPGLTGACSATALPKPQSPAAQGLDGHKKSPRESLGAVRKSPHMAGFENQVGGRRWSPAYKVYQDSHRKVLCLPASHGIRAGSQRGDLSNRVPFGTRPTFPCYPFAHQSASSPTTSE